MAQESGRVKFRRGEHALRTVECVKDHPAVHALGAVMKAWHGLLALVTTADLALATPCPGWDVGAVINHSIAITWKFSAFASGMTDRPRTPGHDFIGDDHRAAFGRIADPALAAWQCADLHRSCHLPFGTVTADLAAGINLFDLLAHGWDIHRATGAAFSCPPMAWRTGLDAARRVIGEPRDPRHFAPKVPARPGASAQVQLLGHLGRAP
jgi:uncharacterized protein (TIGR03086 family)